MSKYHLSIILVLLTFITALPAWGEPLSEPADSGKVVAVNKLAEGYFYKNPDSAILLCNQALSIAKQSGIATETAKAHNNLAKAYYIKGSFFESLLHTDSSLAIIKNINYPTGLANAVNMRGLVYLGQDRFDDAIEEFKKALIINIRSKDSSRMAVNYFNIGLCQGDLQKFDSAFQNLGMALWLARKNKNGHLTQMSLNRIGELNYNKNNYEQALVFYDSALYFKDYQDDWEKSFAYSGKAQTLYELRQYEAALNNAQQSFYLARKLNVKWDIERAAQILSKCYAALGNYKEGYHYKDIARSYRDSLLNEKKDNNINYLHLQEKKSENAELETEIEVNKQVIKRNRLVIVLGSLFSMVLVALLLLLKQNIGQKRILNRVLEERNEEITRQKEKLLSINEVKDRILSVIGHDLRSPFTSVIQAMELLRSGVLEEADRDFIFENFHRQVISVSELINNLLVWAVSLQSGVATPAEKVDLTATTGKIFALYRAAAGQKKQVLKHQCDKEVLVTAAPTHVQIILQNIISNAIKFTPDHGLIEVKYSFGPDYTAIHICDTGTGMTEKKLEQLFQASGRVISQTGTNEEAGTGLGLLLIKQFIDENGGRIGVKSQVGKGSEFIVYFKPYNEPELLSAPGTIA